ncbi:hypothetical protein HOY82DRAFT_588914 [Tuber indicum]|nr:hypothetical protein HOY82DRAFT_588914 [Tuber indicum]
MSGEEVVNISKESMETCSEPLAAVDECPIGSSTGPSGVDDPTTPCVSTCAPIEDLPLPPRADEAHPGPTESKEHIEERATTVERAENEILGEIHTEGAQPSQTTIPVEHDSAGDGTPHSGNEDPGQLGLARQSTPSQNEDVTPSRADNDCKDAACIDDDAGNTIISPLSHRSEVEVDAVSEDGVSVAGSGDEESPQHDTDTTDNYQFPSEEQVLERARTSGSVLFSRGTPNFHDVHDSEGEITTVKRTGRRNVQQSSSSAPSRIRLVQYKAVPLTIPIPDTMLHFFPSNKIPAPKWAPLTLYFPGGRIVDALDPDFRFFNNIAFYAPPPKPLGRLDKSQDARGMVPPQPIEKRIVSIYDFIDKIIAPVEEPEDAEINAKAVEEFVGTYYIEGPDGRPLLNNGPTGDIPQAQINHEWFPNTVMERFRIERHIRLLDLEISPETRAALFWLLVKRQTKRTRVLLELFAQHQEPKVIDVEKQLISWGYLPEKIAGEGDGLEKEVGLMDPKDVIKLDVAKETQELLDALGDAAGNERKMRFLLPFIDKYRSHNMSFFGLMGSDKMIELVTELCRCLEAGGPGSDLPALDIQMGYWSFLHELRPSLLIASSSSLCDIEYVYMVTHRAMVSPDVLVKVAAVMAPIVKRIYWDKEEMPFRREIPDDVKLSLRRIKNAQVTRYLDAHVPPVALPRTRERAPPICSRIREQKKEQARLEAVKKEAQREIMRARVRYMEEDIPRDLAYKPAEIYSPSRRRRKLQEGKARMSRSPKNGKVPGSDVNDVDRESSAETGARPTNTSQMVTRKRRREMVGEMDDPLNVNMRITKASPVIISPKRTDGAPRSNKSGAVRGLGASDSLGAYGLSPPSPGIRKGSGSKKVCLTANQDLTEAEQYPQLSRSKPGHHGDESDSDASSSVSVEDDSDDDQDDRHSLPVDSKREGRHRGHSIQSSESEEPVVGESIQAAQRGGQSIATNETHKTLSSQGDIWRRQHEGARRPPSPVHLSSQQGNLATSTWILPDLDDYSDDSDEEPPRAPSIRAQKAGGKASVQTKTANEDTGAPGTPMSTPVRAPTGSAEAEALGSRLSTPRERTKIGHPIAEEESDMSSQEGTPKPMIKTVPNTPSTRSLVPVPPLLRRSPRKHQPKRIYESDASTDEDNDSDHSSEHTTHRKRQPTKRRAKPGRKSSIGNASKQEKPLLKPLVLDKTIRTGTGQTGKVPLTSIPEEEGDIGGDEGASDEYSPRAIQAVGHVGWPIAEDKGDISDEDETPNPVSKSAHSKPLTPSLSPVLQSVRRSPRKHQPKRTYQSDSSSSDESDSNEDYLHHKSKQKVKRPKTSSGAARKGSARNPVKVEKTDAAKATQVSKTKPVAKTAAEKAEARAAAAKKAAATRAANHKAFVDKIKDELVAEEQRAADAGGYRPGAVTQTQVKRRMKKEKERMKREAAQNKLEAAEAKREQLAAAKKLAATEKQTSAAAKRAATIAAKKASVGGKEKGAEAKATRSQGTFEEANKKQPGKAKVKMERATASERMKNQRAEIAKAKLALAAEGEATTNSDNDEDEEHSADESDDDIEMELAKEISRQEAEDEDNAEALERHREASGKQRSRVEVAQREEVILIKSEDESTPKTKTKQNVTGKSRAKLWTQDLAEEPATAIQAVLNTALPRKKKYQWIEGEGESGESSKGSNHRASKTGYVAGEKGKRSKVANKK